MLCNFYNHAIDHKNISLNSFEFLFILVYALLFLLQVLVWQFCTKKYRFKLNILSFTNWRWSRIRLPFWRDRNHIWIARGPNKELQCPSTCVLVSRWELQGDSTGSFASPTFDLDSLPFHSQRIWWSQRRTCRDGGRTSKVEPLGTRSALGGDCTSP